MTQKVPIRNVAGQSVLAILIKSLVDVIAIPVIFMAGCSQGQTGRPTPEVSLLKDACDVKNSEMPILSVGDLKLAIPGSPLFINDFLIPGPNEVIDELIVHNQGEVSEHTVRSIVEKIGPGYYSGNGDDRLIIYWPANDFYYYIVEENVAINVGLDKPLDVAKFR